LVILVRDYVVQQQPEINMRAAFAAPAGEDAPAQEQQPVAVVPAPAMEQELHFEPVQTPSSTSGSDADTLEDDHDDILAESEGRPGIDSDADHQELLEPQDAMPRVVMPTLQQGAEHLPEDPREAASVNDYMRIFRQASGDKDRILQIIEEEGLQEKLSYWIEITKRGSQPMPTLNDLPGPSDLQAHRSLTPVSAEDSSTAALTPSSSDQSPRLSHYETAEVSSAKGKQRWEPGSPELSQKALDFSGDGPSRARAASDGPQPSSRINYLGSNGWAFPVLPPDSDSRANSNQAMPSLEGGAEPDMGPSHDALSGEVGSPASTWTSINETSSDHDHSDDNDQAHERDAGGESVVGQPETDTDVPGDVVEVRQPIPAVAEDHLLLRLTNMITNFMWGGLDAEHLLQMAEEDLPLPADEDMAEDQWDDEPMEAVLPEDADVNAADLEIAANGGGMDPEAIDDLEDFEGVMELIGMRGPLAGLFQNAIFCAVLVTVTIFACIFFPYNIGRLSLWIIANPMRLARMLFEVSKLLQDATICFAGLGSWFVINLVDIFTSPIGGQVANYVLSLRKASWTLWTGAGDRVLECLFLDFPTSASEIKTFSAVSHDALLTVKGHLGSVVATVDGGISSILAGNVTMGAIASTTSAAFASATNATKGLIDPGSWVLDFSEADTPSAVDPALAHWPGSDRFWAIFAGYATVFIVGALYLKRGAQFPRGSMMQAWEAGFIETLHQASGIVKVILIISIEMLVFPLYCGLLLDAALLPLFEGATFRTRTIFTYNYPLTSIFVHWFVGTGYMFHFALFVSMCRKIMRQGVLCKYLPVKSPGSS
jgi:E3 ubiquitin-protein ligase MARCH6